jgi:hypothetical protein
MAPVAKVLVLAKFKSTSTASAEAVKVVSVGEVTVNNEGVIEARALGAIVNPPPTVGEVVPMPTLPDATNNP